MNKIDPLPKEFERALIPRPSTPHSRWVPPSWGLITATSPKNSKVFISLMPCTFSKILEQNFSYYTDKLLSLHWYLISEHLKVCQKLVIFDSQQNASLTPRNILKGPNVSNFQTLTLKITPGMPKCHNRNLFHYADILWAVIHCDYRDCVNFLPKECSS